MPKGLKKVLIVDDEETLTWSMAKSLAKDKDKYEVMIANNGREALQLLKINKVDLVISDIRMPICTGLQILEALRKAQWTVPVILMTAFGDEATRKTAADLGAVIFDKPFSLGDLRTAVLNLLT